MHLIKLSGILVVATYAVLAFTTHVEAGRLIGVIGDGGGNGLVEIDVTDASSTPLNPLGNGRDGEGIAFNPNDGLLYHTSGITDGFEFFETVDPNSGFTVGPNLVPADTYGPDVAEELSAIEWYAPLGVFLAMDRDASWYHVTTAGAFSNVGTYNGNGAFGYMRGLAVVGNRVFSISPSEDLIEELNPANGQLLSTINFTVNATVGAGGGHALAYDPDTNTIYGAVRSFAGGQARDLATLDLNTGDFTTIGQLPNGLAGLTVITIPEPASVVLLIMGGLALVGDRRRWVARTWR